MTIEDAAFLRTLYIQEQGTVLRIENERFRVTEGEEENERDIVNVPILKEQLNRQILPIRSGDLRDVRLPCISGFLGSFWTGKGFHSRKGLAAHRPIRSMRC